MTLPPGVDLGSRVLWLGGGRRRRWHAPSGVSPTALRLSDSRRRYLLGFETLTPDTGLGQGSGPKFRAWGAYLKPVVFGAPRFC